MQPYPLFVTPNNGLQLSFSWCEIFASGVVWCNVMLCITFVNHAPCLCQCLLPSLTLPVYRLTATGGLQDNTTLKLKRRMQSIASAPFSVGKKIAVGVYRSLCCCGSHHNVMVSKASQNHHMQFVCIRRPVAASVLIRAVSPAHTCPYCHKAMLL